MKQSFKSGYSFGITSGIVTTLGLIVGLSSGTHSELAVIGGILSIAIADGLSESMSMHVARKSENKIVSTYGNPLLPHCSQNLLSQCHLRYLFY